jgi:hypothetical protein
VGNASTHQQVCAPQLAHLSQLPFIFQTQLSLFLPGSSP